MTHDLIMKSIVYILYCFRCLVFVRRVLWCLNVKIMVVPKKSTTRTILSANGADSRSLKLMKSGTPENRRVRLILGVTLKHDGTDGADRTSNCFEDVRIAIVQNCTDGTANCYVYVYQFWFPKNKQIQIIIRDGCHETPHRAHRVHRAHRAEI